MPRPADEGNRSQQERQRRYRQRLRSTGTPEASAVDIAVSGAVTAWMEAVRLEEASRRTAAAERRDALRAHLETGTLSEEEANEAFAELMAERAPAPLAALDPRDMASRIGKAAIALLAADGYDPAAARRIVIRRLGRSGDPDVLDRLIASSKVSVLPKAGRQASPRDGSR
jgi:hypothetical protein